MSTQIIAHRGASGYRPEHTVSAYRLAFAQGADAVEPDLVLSRDGVVVIRHEHDLSASTDVASRPEFASRRREGFGEDGPVIGWFTEDFDWAELETLRAREPRPGIRPENARFDDVDGIMKFTDLLNLLNTEEARNANGRPTRLVAELKHANDFQTIGLPLVDAVRAALHEGGWAATDPRLTFESFEPEPLTTIAGWGSEVVLLEDIRWPVDHVTAADRFDGLSFDVLRLLTEPDLAKRLHDRGKIAYAYTLRSEADFVPEQFRGAAGTGEVGGWRDWFAFVGGCELDAVFADQPDLARATVGLPD